MMNCKTFKKRQGRTEQQAHQPCHAAKERNPLNRISHMELAYQTLVPVQEPDGHGLFIGTITFSVPEEITLDFSMTKSSRIRNADGTVKILAQAGDFCAAVLKDGDRELEISSEQLTYDFFHSREQETYLVEAYTEYAGRGGRAYLPITLESAVLYFQDGTSVDYSSRISVSLLKELADVA